MALPLRPPPSGWSVGASKVTVIVSPAASGTSAVVVEDTTLSIFGRPLPQFTVADTGPGSGSVSVSVGRHSPVPPPL